jgi:hypothetical protein
MTSRWARSLLLGLAASAIGPLLWFSAVLVPLQDYALVGVFIVGPWHQTATALRTLRRSQNPVSAVLLAGVAYWTGVSIGFVIGWSKAVSQARNGDGLAWGLGVLAWSWALASAFTVAIAAVTGGLYGWRVLRQPRGNGAIQ